MMWLSSRRFMVLRSIGGLLSLGDFKAGSADLCQELVAMALQVVGRGAVDGDAHAARKVGAGGVRRRIVAALQARQHLPVPRDARVDELPDPGRWQVLREGQDEEEVRAHGIDRKSTRLNSSH